MATPKMIFIFVLRGVLVAEGEPAQ